MCKQELLRLSRVLRALLKLLVDLHTCIWIMGCPVLLAFYAFYSMLLCKFSNNHCIHSVFFIILDISQFY